MLLKLNIKRGGIHWHILFWVEPDTVPDNVVMWLKCLVIVTYLIYKLNMLDERHRNTRYIESVTHHGVLRGMVENFLSKCKYGFPFKVPQYTEELDEDGIRIIYRRRCKEDCLVVPYNLPVLLF